MSYDCLAKGLIFTSFKWTKGSTNLFLSIISSSDSNFLRSTLKMYVFTFDFYNHTVALIMYFASTENYTNLPLGYEAISTLDCTSLFCNMRRAFDDETLLKFHLYLIRSQIDRSYSETFSVYSSHYYFLFTLCLV